ncbi:MAG: PqqD family protein [Thermoleophilaceae bacterium]
MKPASEVVFVEVEGEMVLMDGAGERYYALDDVGARFWQLLLERGDVDAAVAGMLDEYDVDEARLRADIDALIEQLAGAGLVVATDAAA